MKNKGQALVEFAIILPILIFIIAGIIEFGMMLNSYLTIQNASREGARYGIMGANDSEIIQIVRNISPNLDDSKLGIEITPGEGSRKSGDTINVKVIYDYELIVPVISNLLGNNIELKAETSMRVE
ncbi:TadE-like protein [Caloramator mitchellensis]|uniref:TadE-like protein n=1 Tax=Caloramator mitchellensis TaxID=908809 RepID=A0A0R3JTD4_CALMK|nr:TadE family protein [Caloramator mitchellensis]KRQ86266.1 TadE-like protein [Caloramator mitchellensis]